MMRAGICGAISIMCLILDGCGLHENIHGQSVEQSMAQSKAQSIEQSSMHNTVQNAAQSTIQSSEQEETEVSLPVDTWEQSAYRIFEDGLIDVEIQRNSGYSLWNQELGQTILMCPYDEVHLLSKGYEELEQAIDALNVENANYMGVF